MTTMLRGRTTNEEVKSVSSPAKWVGQPIRRKEEDRLVRGKGIFVDDQKLTGMLHIRFVRSSYGHAKIARIGVSKAAALPGVVCTLTGAEVKGMVKPFIEIGPDVGQKIADYPMAVDKVTFQGEPVAAVVAETRMIAEDAAELVEVECEPLPPILSAEEALKDETLVHPEMGTNRKAALSPFLQHTAGKQRDDCGVGFTVGAHRILVEQLVSVIRRAVSVASAGRGHRSNPDEEF